jgi:hypothetical protein
MERVGGQFAKLRVSLENRVAHLENDAQNEQQRRARGEQVRM